jgi:hypothetical protein
MRCCHYRICQGLVAENLRRVCILQIKTFDFCSKSLHLAIL